MKKIKHIFLPNYKHNEELFKNTNPFEHYTLKGTLWEGCYVPCSITSLYPFAYLSTFIFQEQWLWILIVTALIITLHRYVIYKMAKFSLLAMLLVMMCMYFLTIKPLSWIIIYIFPILYWSSNNKKLSILEIIQDIFCLIVIPYIFF